MSRARLLRTASSSSTRWISGERSALAAIILCCVHRQTQGGKAGAGAGIVQLQAGAHGLSQALGKCQAQARAVYHGRWQRG